MKRELKTLLLGSTCKWYIGFPNNHFSKIISNGMSNVMHDNDGKESRTEIYSHINMVVVGKHVKVLADTGNKVDASLLILYYQDL